MLNFADFIALVESFEFKPMYQSSLTPRPQQNYLIRLIRSRFNYSKEQAEKLLTYLTQKQGGTQSTPRSLAKAVLDLQKYADSSRELQQQMNIKHQPVDAYF